MNCFDASVSVASGGLSLSLTPECNINNVTGNLAALRPLGVKTMHEAVLPESIPRRPRPLIFFFLC